jgi:hypothetical protein
VVFDRSRGLGVGGYVWKPTEGSWTPRGERFWHPLGPRNFRERRRVWLYYTSNVRIGYLGGYPEGPPVDQLDHPLIGNGYGGVGDGVLPDVRTPSCNFDDRLGCLDARASSGDLYLLRR